MDDVERGQMPSAITRRRAVAGVVGLGVASLLGARMANAQESGTTATPGAETDESETGDDSAEDVTRVDLYQNFLGKLSTSLGVADAATIDTAIRDALKAMIDERFDAGEISANDATARKTWIDEADVPIAVGFPGRHRRGERMGRGEFGQDSGDHPNDLDDGEDGPSLETDDMPDTTATPTT